ncbi:hypothetical protein PSP6_520011 [Paraburkholderia tropica]|nr:hypothetical protein PSP6_520011 [Paraburkholderia tropica]
MFVFAGFFLIAIVYIISTGDSASQAPRPTVERESHHEKENSGVLAAGADRAARGSCMGSRLEYRRAATAARRRSGERRTGARRVVWPCREYRRREGARQGDACREPAAAGKHDLSIPGGAGITSAHLPHFV